jgi:hypothetical protein
MNHASLSCRLNKHIPLILVGHPQSQNMLLIISYSLRPIILFVIIDESRHIFVIDTSVLAKSNMDRREYKS